jgi:hypothetical protein
MRKYRLIAAALAAGTAAIAITAYAQKGPDSGPVARYDVRAGTTSGFGGMGGGRPNIMAMMGGGGSQVQHELLLRLGSSTAPAGGAPKADHFMPTGAKLGKSVALYTPKIEPAREEWQGERPKGRLLLYWGCGEHAPKGQPVVLDFAKLAAGQFPPGLWTTTIPADLGPNSTNSKTFGHWPADDGKSAKPDSSLLGVHRIAGNYSPEINFTLTKDFMRPLSISTAAQKSGASLLSWGTIPEVTGYIATLIGGKQGPGGQMGDMVMWTSSANRQFGGGLTDWLSPSQVVPLVRDGTLMGPQATTCTVPAEVTRDTPDFRVGTLAAFGPEEDFAYPPRPTAPKARWDLQWTARIRHRSTTNWMEAQGMTMGTADDENSAGQTSGQKGQKGQKSCKPKGGLLGGLAGAVMGGSGC